MEFVAFILGLVVIILLLGLLLITKEVVELKGLTTYTFSIWVDDNTVHIEASDMYRTSDDFKLVKSIRDVKVFMKQYRGIYDW